MARKTTTSTLRRVRRVLLVGLLVFVAALVGLYVLGRQPANGLAPAKGTQTLDGPEVTTIGQGFRYEVTEDGKKLFNIEADRLLSDESALYILENVKVTMQRDNGSEYSMTAKRGTYRLELNEATLDGDVVLTGSGGLRLETEGLELSRKGNLVVSSAPVKIEMGDSYRGSARRLEVLFPRNRLVLAGKVVLETAPGVLPRASLKARRAVFFRDTHNFLAEGRVELTRDEDTLKARRLSLNFDDLDRNILFARASWEVEASLVRVDEDGSTSLAQVAGDDLSIVFDEETGDPERLEIGSLDGDTARLTSSEATGLVRTLTADYLWGDFEDGSLRQAQGLGGVTVDESRARKPRDVLRHISSESADASYDDSGSLSSIVLDGGVMYEEDDLRAGGTRLTAQGDDGRLDLVGDLAWIQNEDGRLEAPEIRFERDSGKAFALGGVRAEMASKSSPDLATRSEARDPTRIEAGRAEWTREPQEFRFDENVRAWQGENFLVSQTLALAGDELTAEGGVRSVWQKRSGEQSQPAGQDEAPISIAATKMRYIEPEGRLVFEGNARIVQGRRSMGCPLLQLEMNDDQDFERMYCEGGTLIADDESGSRITGTAAIYNTRASKVKVLGEPVRLTQSTGGVISARLMVYDFETAIAEVDSVKDEDADLFMTASEFFQQFVGPAQPLQDSGFPPDGTGLPPDGTGLPPDGAIPGATPPVPVGEVDEDGLPLDSPPQGQPPAIELGVVDADGEAVDPSETEIEADAESDDGDGR